MTSSLNSFNARRPLEAGLHFFSLADLGRALQRDLSRLPFSIRVLLENLLRLEDGRLVTTDDVRALAAWTPTVRSRCGTWAADGCRSAWTTAAPCGA